MKKYDVAALGEILIDFTYSGKNSQGQRLFAQNAGGAVANVAAALGGLGDRVLFVGKAGNDMHGRFLRETLVEHRVDVSGLKLSDEYFTTLAFVSVQPDGEREFSFARAHGADKMLTQDDVLTEWLDCSEILHVGAVSLTEEPARSTVECAVKRAHELGLIVSYDPNYRASLWSDEQTAVKTMRSLIQYVDIMKISDEEAVLLTGERDPHDAAEVLISQGVKIAVVTLGKDGAYVRTKDGARFAEAFTAKAVDATGAGDSFWAGFLHKLIGSGKRPEAVTLDEAAELVRYGNAVASICVERMGAIPAMPTPDEVEARLMRG